MIEDNPSSLLLHLAFVLGRQADQLLQERLGIGMSQYKILNVLESGSNSSHNQKDIASRLGQTEASISRQIKLLLDKGITIVSIDPSNRRQHKIAITDKGSRLMLAAHEVLLGLYEDSVKQLTAKQQTQLNSALNLLHESICALGKTAACDPLPRIWQMS
jgi:DNA-binding MarR family transcriptional regulator